MAWYPSANTWEDHGYYHTKYKTDSDGNITDILYARAGLSRREADAEHIHIWKLGTSEQGNRFKDANGKYYNLSDHMIQMIINGNQPLL